MELKVWGTSQIVGITDRDYDLRTERRFAKVAVVGEGLSENLDCEGTCIRIIRVHEVKGLDLDMDGPVWLGVDFEVWSEVNIVPPDIKLLEVRNAAGEIVAEAPLIVHDIDAAIKVVRRNTDPGMGGTLSIDTLRSLEAVKGLSDGVRKFTVLKFDEAI